MTNDEVVRHGAVDYTQSSSLAELACRWAEQRRLALEVLEILQASCALSDVI